jgi:hypothetical protein
MWEIVREVFGEVVVVGGLTLSQAVAQGTNDPFAVEMRQVRA